jgi:molybdopterin molybdotransferase
MRAQITTDGVTVADRQDSGLLTVLSQANALVVRPPHDPPRSVGDNVQILDL